MSFDSFAANLDSWVNLASSLALVLAGAYVAFHPTLKAHRVLASFLMIWGAQGAVTNAATLSDLDTARILYTIGEAALPLQGVLLLYYVQATLDLNRKLRQVALWGVGGLAALTIVGILWTAIDPGNFVYSAVGKSGNPTMKLGILDQVFFQVPRYIGVAAAFALWGFNLKSTTETRKEWKLASGLFLAWAFATISPLLAVFFKPEAWRFVVLGLAVILLVAAFVGFLLAARRGEASVRKRNLGLTIASACVVVANGLEVLIGVKGSPPWSDLGAAVVSAGGMRIVALAWILPALRYDDLAKALRAYEARYTVLPVLTAAACLVLAMALLGVAILTPLTASLKLYASTFILAGLGLITFLGAWTILRPSSS